MRFRALLLLAIAAGIHAGPIGLEEGTCSTTCVPAQKFGYEQGRTYRFDYEADTVTSVVEASEEHSALHIRSTVDISVQSTCELVLTLRDSTLGESTTDDLSRRQLSPNNGEFREALEKNPLRFSFQDGRIESICTTEDEPEWVANFKRGILSAFQNSMENFDNDATVSETDISGKCDTDYKISKSGLNSILLTKTKNLLSCTERTSYFTALQATEYSTPSKVQSMPLLRSTHECKQTISTSGVLQLSECEETHVIRPFNKKETGPMTTVKQVLKYKTDMRQATPRTGPVTERKSMLYQHEERKTVQSNDQTQVVSILGEICNSNDIRPETPRLFSKLVYSMRQLNEYTLKKVHRLVKRGLRECGGNTEIARKFFYDAIPATKTSASISLIRDLIKSGEISETEAEIWITSLAFVQEPTAQAVREAKEFITSDRNTKAFLAVSSLVNKYCGSHDCNGNSDVDQIITTLTSNLGYNCRDAPQNQEMALLSLKAIGNAGISRNTVATLARCAANGEIPMEIRVAAVQAYRRIPCSESRESLMNLLMNTEEDSELRINAYLGVMRCPSEVIVTQIKDLLEQEKVNQVGSFIWTHLTNLKETDDPLKKEIRAILEDELLSKEFNLDARKFSRNYEGSLFLDRLNAGASYESNVIFSPASFLPRSAMLNLTVDMFGSSVNLLEVGLRMEGVEKYLEKFFGPDGYFPQSTVSDIIKGQIDSIDSNLREKMMQSDPKVSLYMKMFGNELKHFDLTGIEKSFQDINILDILIKLAQRHEVDITRSTNFVDAEMTVPTVAGLPLKLALNGTATVHMKLGGKMDIRKAATSPSSFDIDGYVKPSGAVTFATSMGVDACMARTGLKMVTTLHSSTELTGKVSLEDSKIMLANINVPQEKVEILNVERKFYIVHREEEREQQMLTDNVIDKSLCTGEIFNKITGMKVCGAVRVPLTNKATAPNFWYTGPMSMQVYLETADTHRNIEFEARVETLKERRSGRVAITNLARLAFDTPGSQTDRRFLAEYNLDRSEKTLTAQLRSPWKEASIDGSLTNTDELKNANIQMTVDGRWKYGAVAEVAVSDNGDARIYTPNFSISAPRMEPITLTGKTKIVPMQKVDIDLSLANMFSKDITVTGGIEKTSANRFTTNLNLASPVLSSKVTGFCVIKEGMYSTRTEVKYSIGNRQQQQLIFNGKFKDTSTKYAHKYSVNTAIQTTEFPDYNMHLESNFILNRKHMESSLEFKYGRDPNDDTKKIVFEQNADFSGDVNAFEAQHSVKAMWKAVGVNVNGQLTHKHDLYKEMTIQGELQYKPGKKVDFDYKMQKPDGSLLVWSHELKVNVPRREMRLYSNINEKQPRTYSHELIAQWQQGRYVRTMTDYSADGQTHTMKSELRRPNGAVSVLSGEIVANPEDFKSKMDLSHEGQTYSTKVDYTYMLRPNNKNIAGRFEMAIPQRRVVLETAVGAVPQTYTAKLMSMWDADRDSSKKVDINGQLLLKPNKHEGEMKVIYPGRQVALAFNQMLKSDEVNHHFEMSWHPSKTINIDVEGKMTGDEGTGNLKVSTPFFNEITMAGNTKRNGNEVSGHVELNYGKEISADFTLKPEGWKNVESSVTVNTPFSGFEKMSLATKHVLTPQLKEVHVEIAKNSEKMETTAKLESNGGKHEGSAEVSYPGRKVSLEFNCQKTPTAMKHHSQISWNSGKPVTLDVDTTYSPPSMKGMVKLSTPWTANDITVNVNAERTSVSFEGHAEIDYGQKISSDVSCKRSNGWKAVESSFVLHTPFSRVDRVRLASSHNLVGAEKKINIEVEKNAAKIEFDASGKFVGDSIETEVHLNTPYFEPVALMTKGTVKPTEAEGKLEVQWQRNKVELEVESQYQANRLEGKLNLKTPYTEPVELRGEASTANNEMTVHLEGQCQNKKVELDLTGKLHSQLIEGSAQLKTPYTRPIAIRSSTSFSTNEGSSSLEVQWNNKKIEVEASGKCVHGRVRDMAASVTIKTPYTEDIHIEASHQDDGRDFKTNMLANWSSRQQVDIKMTMTHNTNGIYFTNNGQLTVVTPIQQLRNLAVKWDQDFQGWKLLKSKNEIVYDGKTISLNVEHSFQITRYSQKLSTEVGLETPFSEIRDASGSVSYVFNKRKLQGSSSFNYNSQTYLTLSTATTFSDSELSTQTQLQSVIPHAEDLSISGSLKHADNPATGELELKWASGKVITLKSEFQPKLGGFSGNLVLNTPCKSLQQVTATYDYEYDGTKLMSKGSLEYAPDKKVTIESSLQLNREVSASLDITSPCPYIRKLSTSFSHRGYWSSFNHNSALEFEMDRVNVNYNGQLNVRGLTRINGNAKVTTPFRYFRNHEVTIDHNLEGSEYITKATYQFNRKNINVESHFQNANGIFKVRTDVTSSFQAAQSLSVEVEHQYHGQGCSGKATFESNIMQEPATFSASYEKGSAKLSGEVLMSTPFRGFENIAGRVSYNAPSVKEISVSAEVELDSSRKMALSMEISFRDGFSILGSVETPFSAMRLISLDISHKLEHTTRFETRGKVQLHLEDGEMELAGNVQMNRYKLLKGDLLLKTPYANAELFSVKLNHEVQRLNGYKEMSVEQELSVEYPHNKKISLTRVANYKTSSANHDEVTATIVFTSPFHRFENIEWKQDGSRDFDKFAVDHIIKSSGKKIIDFEVNFDGGPLKKFSLEIDTIYEQMSHLSYEGQWSKGLLRIFEQSTDLTGKFSGAIVVNGLRSEISGESSFKTTGSTLDGSLSLSKLDKSLSYMFDIGQVTEISSTIHLEAKDNKVIEVEGRMSAGRKEVTVNGELHLTSPRDFSGKMAVDGPMNLRLEFVHKGLWKNFEQNLVFSKGRETTMYEGKFTTRTGQFKLTSPYKPVEIMELEFDVNGKLTDFVANGAVTYAPGKKIQTQANFKLESGLQASLTFTAPFCEDVSVSINHEGTTEFQHTTQASYGNAKMVLSGEFHMRPKIEGKVKVQTPFAKAKVLEAEFTHTGNVRKFSTVISLKHNKKNTVSAEINMDRRRGFTGDIQIDSSFGKMFSLDFDHNTNFPEFTTKGTLQWWSKTISLDSAFAKNPTAGHFKLQTPWRAVRDIDVTLTHSGPNNNFESSARATYNGGSPVEANLKFSNEKIMKGSFELTTPFEGLRRLTGEFTHKYTRYVLQCHGKVDINGQVVTGDVDFKNRPIDGTVQLQTPFKHFEDIKVSLTHKQKQLAIDTALKIDHNEYGTIQTNVKVDADPLEATLMIETPSEYMKNVMVKFNHKGSLTDFTNSLEFQHNLIGKTQYTGEFKLSPTTVGEFKLETPCPHLKVTTLSFRLDGSLMDFTSSAEFYHDKLGKASLEANFNPASGNIAIQSRCPYMRDVRVEFKRQDGKTNGELNYNGKVWKSVVEIQSAPLAADISLEMPSGESFGIQFSHSGKSRNFQSKLALLRNRNPFVSGQMKLDVRSGISTEIQLSTPLTGDVELIYDHKGTWKQFTCKPNLKINGQSVINGELKFDSRPFEVSVDLQTTWRQMRNIKATVSHTGRLSNFRSMADLELNNARYHGEITFKLTQDSVSLDMATPIQSLRRIQVSGTHSGELRDFHTTATATLNEGTAYNLDVTFKLTPSEMTLVVKPPCSKVDQVKITATHTQSGGMAHFGSSIEVSKTNGENVVLGMSLNLKPSEVNVEIQTPFSWMRNLEVTASHEGSLENFRSSMDVSINSGRKQHFEVAFNMRDTSVNMEVQTPVSWLRQLAVTGTFVGTVKKCEASVEVQYNNGRKHLTEVSYEIKSDGISLDLKTPCPYARHLELQATVSGTRDNFKSNFQINYNDNGVYELQVNYKLTPTELEIDLKTPISWMKHLEATVTFSGTIDNFMTKIVASHNDGPTHEMDAKFKVTSNELNLEMHTPIYYLRQLDLAITYSGKMSDFKTSIDITHNNGGKYHADITFSLPKGNLILDLQTPHRHVRNLQVMAKHTGNMRNFKTNMEVTHNGDKKYYADASFSQSPAEGKITVQTPWRRLRDATLSFNHEGDRTAFTTSGELIHNGEKLGSASVDFSHNPFSGSMKVMTPIKGAEETTLTFSHNGNYRSSQQHGELSLFGKKYTLDASFSKNPAEIQLTLTTPHASYEKIEFLYNHKGNLRSTYFGHAEVTYKEGKKVELDVEFKFYRRLNIGIDLKTPFRNVALNFRHEHDNGVVKSLVEVDYGNGGNMKATLDLNLGLNANGKLQVNTPFRGFEELAAEFDQQISGNSLTSQGSVTFNGKQVTYKANGQYTDLTNLAGKIEIRTPFRNAEYFMLSDKLEGEIRSLMSELEIVLPREYTVKGTFTLDTRSGIKANLKSNIRMIEDIVVDISHSSSSGQLSTSGEITYGSTRLMSFSVDFTKESRLLVASAKFSSPLKYMENLYAEIRHEGDCSNFKSSALGSWRDGKEIKVNAEYNSADGIPKTVGFTVTAPLMKPVTLQFNNVMNNQQFDITANIGWGRDQAIDMSLHGLMSGTWKRLNVRTNGQITTPFNRMSHMSFAAEHEHSHSNVDSSFNWQHNRRNMMDSKVTLTASNGNVKVIGPVTVNMNYERNNNGGFITMDSPVSVNGRYTVNDGEIIVDVTSPLRVDAKLEYSPNGGKFTMRSPFKVDGRLQYNKNGGSFRMLNPIKVDASAQFNRNGGSITMNEPVTVDAKVQYDRNGGVVTMTTPFEVDASYTLNNNDFTVTVRKPFTVEASGTYSKTGGTFNMQQPIVVETSFGMSNDGASFEIQKPCQFDAAYTYTGNSGSFKMENPMPIDVSFSVNRNGGSVNINKPYPFDAKITYNRNGGSFSIQNPFPVDAELRIQRDGASFTMSNPYPIDVSYSYTGNSGSIKMSTPYQIDAGYTLDRDSFSVDMKAPFTINARHQINDNSGSFSMDRPYQIDVKYSLGKHLGSLEMQQPCSINLRYDLNKNSGSLEMQHPYTVDMKFNLGKNSGYFEMQNPYPVDTKYTVSATAGSFEMQRPYAFDLMYNITSDAGSVEIKQPFAIEAKYTLNKEEGRFTLEKPVSFDMSYTYRGKQGSLVMTQPLQMSASYDVQGDSCKDIRGSMELNWNTNRRGSNAKVEFMHKDDSTQYVLKRAASLKTILPTRTTELSASIEKSSTKFMQTTEVTWDEAKGRKVSYLIDYSRKTSYYSQTGGYDLTARLSTPIRSMEFLINHVDEQNKKACVSTLKWDSARDQTKMVTVNNVMLKEGSTYTHDATISSPLMNNDITFHNEIHFRSGNVFYECKHELKYSNDPSTHLVAQTRFADDGNSFRGNHNYTALLALSHPKSALDVDIRGFLALTDIVLASGFNIDYMTVDKQVKTASLMTEINKIRKTFNIELDTPVKRAEVRGSLTRESDLYKYNIMAKDESREVSTDITVNREDSSFDVEAHLNPQNPAETITLKGNYLSPTSLKVQALHSDGRQQVEDSEISINMDNQQLLRTRLHWRPAIFSDLKSAASTFMNNVDVSPVWRTWRQTRRAVDKEIQSRCYTGANFAFPSFTPIKTFLESESDSFSTDFKVVKKEFKRMYWNNEFYMRSIESAVKKATDTLYVIGAGAVQRISEMTNEISEVMNVIYTRASRFLADYFSVLDVIFEEYVPVMIEKFRQVMSTMSEKLATLTRSLLQWTADCIVGCFEMLGDMLTSLRPYVEKYIQWVSRVSEWIREKCDHLTEKYNAAMSSYPLNRVAPMYNKVMSVTSKYSRQLAKVNIMAPVYNAHISLSGKINDMAETMARHADRLGDKYASIIYTAHRAIGRNVDNYIHRPASEYIRAYLAEFRDKAKWAYEHLGIEEMTKNFMDNTMDWAITMVKSNALYLTEKYLHLDLTKVVAYDPVNGDFDFQIWIPNSLPDFQMVPFTNVRWSDLWDRITDIRNSANVAVPDEMNPWDYYYMYKPVSWNPLNWIPPFKAMAFLTGQHVKTFDDRHYEFLGTCSYVLARDIIDRSFTIIKDYEKDIYRVFVGDKQIDIAMSGQVTINGAATEIPVDLDLVTITRSGDSIIVESKRRFTAMIDTRTQLFSLEISGWYYNKVAGLLGNYNNEQYDDLTMTNGQITEDVTRFTDSWKVGTCTEHANKAVEHFLDESKRSGTVCKFLFECPLSPLRKCFKVINPKGYLDACVNDVEETADDKKGVCRVVNAYAMACEKQGVNVTVPRPCRKCQDEVQNTNPKSADIIFVVEQKPCNGEMVSRIDNLALMVDKALNNKGLGNNRFGLIGFGGEGVHDLPHSHTITGQLMGPSRQMKSAAESLVFSDEGHSKDAIGALKLAAGYPFRAGVAKTVIMMTCAPCGYSSQLGEVEKEMLTAGIQLHMMVEHEFTTSSQEAAPKTSYLYGIDSETAYTKTDVRSQELTGDQELHKQINKPDNMCAKLALDTHGSFFNLQKLKEGRVRYQKHFMDVFARRVAKTAQSEECSVCECSDEGVKVCKPCDNTILGRPNEEPAQFYDQDFERDLQEYLSSP